MKKIIKYIILILLLSIIGATTIYLSKSIVSKYDAFLTKQIIFIIIGLILMLIFRKLNYEYLSKHSSLIYIIGCLLLVYVLLFGLVVNGSKAWINILGFRFQPSEFVKISILISLDKYMNKKNGLFICLIILIIPSILTFLEPDTGAIIFYLVMFFSIFLSNGIKKKYYIITICLLTLLSGLFFFIYFFKKNDFINIFGTTFFYRIDRLINFINSEGYQINNALIGIGNGGLFGNFLKYVNYIPEVITDFMFANILIRFGFVGGLITLIIFIVIDIYLINDIKTIRKHKYFVRGLLGLFLYQQIQHILMNIGLFPIMGITLPFVSYGGSSIISYYILFGILFNIKKYQFDT